MQYNNGKSEVDVNERRQNYNERSNGKIWNGNVKESTETNRKYSWEEYEGWEESIKPIEAERLAESKKKSIKDAKTDYNKTVRLYNEDKNDNTYSGGASKKVPGQISISRQQTQYFGLDYMIAHKNVESDIIHIEEANDILEPVNLEIAEKVDSASPTKTISKFPNWEYYKVDFEIGGKNFEGLINIGIDKNGNKHFYEINKIHSTGISSVSTNSQHREDSINNSILPTQENVNSDTQKYSMQENEKNIQNNENSNRSSFSLPKNIENLVFNEEFYDQFKFSANKVLNIFDNYL